MALSRLGRLRFALPTRKMSEPKVPKLKERAAEAPSTLRVAEMSRDAVLETSTSTAPQALTSAKSSIAIKTQDDLDAPPRMKKAKTGLGEQKKRKHIKVDEEDEFEGSGSRRAPVREPKGWRELLAIIEKAREGMVAPVDEVGAESLGDWHDVKNGTLSAKDARFRTLLALMLSSQTKDAVTAAAMVNLRNHFVPLSVASMLNATEEEIDTCINKVGFHNKKSVYIKKTIAILHETYDDDVPDTIKKMTDLPGVGPKMAFLLMQIAWEKVIGIGVDTHVHRLSNRYNWVSTKNPEETREALQTWLPKEYWATINKTLVGFGQMMCLPIGPKCKECPAAHICPASSVPRPSKREKPL